MRELLRTYMRAIVKSWILRNQLARAEAEVDDLRRRLLASTLNPVKEPIQYLGTDADHMPLPSYTHPRRIPRA